MLTFFYWGQNVHSIYIWTRWLANPQGSLSQRHNCIKISRLWLQKLRSCQVFALGSLTTCDLLNVTVHSKFFHSDAQQREFLILSCDCYSDCGCVWLIVWHPVTWNSKTIVSVKPSDWEVQSDFNNISFGIVVLRWMLTNSNFSVCGNLSRAHAPRDVPAAVNPAAFPVLSNHFPAVEEMLCEERSACLCSMFTSHLLCACLPRTWAITAHYGDNYLGYNLSYFLRKTSTTLCAHHGATRMWKKKQSAASQTSACFIGNGLRIIFAMIIAARFVIGQLLCCCFFFPLK